MQNPVAKVNGKYDRHKETVTMITRSRKLQKVDGTTTKMVSSVGRSVKQSKAKWKINFQDGNNNVQVVTSVQRVSRKSERVPKTKVILDLPLCDPAKADFISIK